MADLLLVFWIAVLAVTQAAWCIYYATHYRWRSTPLGPVWLAKGGMLAVLWPALLVDQFADLNDWIWAGIIAPALAAATVAWLVVTVRVARRRDHPARKH